VFLGRRKPRFKVCISKNIPHPVPNFGWYVFQKNILVFLTGKVCFRGYVFEKMQIVGAGSKPDFNYIPPKTYP
jgi:hypothetical protein